MTIQQIEQSDKLILVPADVADVLGCAPYSINLQAQDDPTKLGFPVAVLGRNVRIPRVGFLNWFYHNQREAV